MNKINYWLIFQWYCIIVKSSPAPDVTIVSQKLNYSDIFNITCILSGENLNSGIVWIPAPYYAEQIRVSKYVPTSYEELNCKMIAHTTCTSTWTNENWNIQNSFFTSLDVVTDTRWEEFQVITTRYNYKPQHVHRFDNDHKNKLTINFSIRVETEVDIFLCTSEDPIRSNCYWIIINSNQAEIRKCLKYEINYDSIKSAACRNYRKNIKTLQYEFLSNTSWKHFTIGINKNNVVLKLRTNSITLLNYTDNEHDYIDVHNLLVKCINGVAHWKFHNYDFSWTTTTTKNQLGPTIKTQENKFCISLYIAMCSKCSLIISALQSTTNEIFTKTVKVSNEFKWQNVKWNISLPTISEVLLLYLETQCVDNNCDGQFWALDDFRVCAENEVRVLNVQESPITAFALQIVDDSLKSFKMENFILPRYDVQFPDSKCPIDSIGSTSCTKCSDIFSVSKPFCDASIICDFSINEEGICRCSPGFLGLSCHQPCSIGYYGQDCKEKCGSCQSTSCNSINGDCPNNKCRYNFTGKQCNIPPYPVLRNTPIVTDYGDNHITIKVTNFSYYGSGTPDKFKIIYYKLADNTNIGTETRLYNFHSAEEIPLNNLQSETSYEIRVVLITPEKKFYNGEDIPKLIANTTCADIQEEDIPKIFTTTNTSAIVTFGDNPKLCPLKYYKINCYNDNGSKQVNHVGNQFDIQGLLPYTEYTLNIVNINTRQGEINYKFTTKEGVSSPVLFIKLLSSKATSLTISWEKPKQPNGEIRHYEIKYKHYKYLACDVIINDNVLTRQHQLTTITLNYLIPFSEYSIEIAAVTIVTGKFSRTLQNTTETDVPDQSEIPTGIEIQPSSKTVDLSLKQAKCSLVEGQLEYFISTRCTNDWCLNIRRTLNTSYHLAQKKLTLTGLLPYSMYVLDVIVGRSNGNVYKEKQLTETFQTQPAEPNVAKFDIYEKSNKMLRLRITPPYPPTGILEMYLVSHLYLRNYGLPNTISKYFEPINCKIWTKYHCIDISDLKQKSSYGVWVQAKNINISTLSSAAYNESETTQGLSTAPEELRYSWDNYYNLTLQWNHPSFTNGPLTKFSIMILTENKTSCYMYDYMVTEETTKLTYSYVVSLENKHCYTSKIIVTIRCVNMFAGGSANLNIDSPPETPSLNNKPSVESVSNTSITIALSAKEFLLSESFMYIVLSESKSKFEISDVGDLYKLENLRSLTPPWLIAKYNLNTELPMKSLTIGSNESNSLSNNDGTSNTAITLSQNTSYTITIIIYNEYQNITRYRVYEIVNSTSGISKTLNNNSSNGALFSLLLLFLLPLAIWIYIRKRKTGKWCLTNLPNMLQRNPDVIPLQELTSESVAPEPKIPPKHIIYSNVNVSIDDKIISNEFSKPIKLNDFSRYVKNAITTGELARQHSLFPRGQTKPWDYGSLPQNKSKNRYNNLIAYDHTRVKLEKVNNDQYSDYINANYIDGYISKNAYIATQGPKLATINDFWKMVWQENVKFIVMLANVLEGGKKKTEQYWPNINQTSQFGNISITYVSTVIFADYEHRTFLAISNNIERQIEQLHFTSWPDHGIPMYSQSLVPLFKKLLSIPQEKSPILVHCSAGVGRTGTVVLCDLCLRMSLREGVIDVLKHQHKIREQRANLVDNLEQYKLVHLVLLDCLLNPDTSITCDAEAEKNILHILETDKLEKQFQHIGKIAWQDQAMRPVTEVKQKPEWKQKNKSEDIIASGYGHIFLSRFPATDEHSDYINAVEVDGFKARKRFIATQQPLPNTISDFWRMIDEKDVSIIVSLNDINKNDNKSCVFWPTSKISDMQPVPYLVIKFLNEICNDEIITVNVELHNKKNKDHAKRDIKLIKLKGWLSDELIPNSDVSLLKLFNEVEKVSQNKNPIVVTCYDGAAACGLFIAFTFLIEKIKLEHQCDVCLAVRTVRHNRDQFVQNLEQFKYLYRAAIAYLSTFELYSNFL